MGFSFQEPPPQVVVEVGNYLRSFEDQIADFGRDEGLARQVLDLVKKNDWAAMRDLPLRNARFGSSFWQSRDWFFAMQKIVPFLVLELAKYNPANMQDLSKASKFWSKPFRYSPKSMSPDEENAKKYLSVLKELRGQLKTLQEAAKHLRGGKPKGTQVGSFTLYDSLGSSDGTLRSAEAVLKTAGQRMTHLGLGEYCYGPVILTDSGSFEANASAFYVRATDEIFMSPNLGAHDVRAFCHEVAHRVYVKLHLDARAEDLYQTVRDKNLWVTGYARTSAEENFCEMVSFAAIGDLPEESRGLLHGCLSSLKLAGRVVARHLGVTR